MLTDETRTDLELLFLTGFLDGFHGEHVDGETVLDTATAFLAHAVAVHVVKHSEAKLAITWAEHPSIVHRTVYETALEYGCKEASQQASLN